MPLADFFRILLIAPPWFARLAGNRYNHATFVGRASALSEAFVVSTRRPQFLEESEVWRNVQ